MRLRALFRNLFRRPAVERDLDAELRSYVEMLADEKIARGTPPDIAVREAGVETGGLEPLKERVRDVRTGALAEQLLQDLRYGMRMLRRRPGFTLVAVATLAVAIGANTAIFSVVNTIVLRPLPYRDPGALIRLIGVSYTGEFVELQRRARSFDVAAYVPRQVIMTGREEPERTAAASVSPNLVLLLGVDAAIGRVFTDGDELQRDGAVVLISDQLWRSRFDGDRSVVGRRITLDGVSRTIVGVMPPDFAFPQPAIQLWIPDPPTLDRVALWSTSRFMIARVKPGFTPAQADAELRALAPGFRPLFPWGMPVDYGSSAKAISLKEALVGDVRPMLQLLLAAVAGVLLMASVNISHLLLSRTLARRRELAVRASLGAGRGRILRQVLTEGVLLVALGGAAGLLLAYAGVHLLAAWLPADMPRRVSLSLDARLLGFAFFLFAACAAIVAALPAIRAARADVVSHLSEGGRTSQGRRTRMLSHLLVATQVALAMVLTVSASLLVRSLGNLYAVRTGFESGAIVTARISPPAFRFTEAPVRRDLFDTILGRLAKAPDVVAVALTDRLPFSGEVFGSVFVIEGRPHPATTGEWPLADVSAIVTPGYFSTLGIPLRDGRDFTPGDTGTSERVAIVSETLARRYWPGQSALGRRFSFPGDRAGFRTVVGIVADVKWERVTDDQKPALFLPLAQSSPGPMHAVVRTSGEHDMVLAHVRSIVRSIDPDTPVDQAHSLGTLIGRSVEQPRFAALLLAAFAVAGLVLGAIGVYGTVADQVAERRREIGVRLALGARRVDILRAVLDRTMIVACLGMAAGLAAAVLTSRLLVSMLYDVTPTDPGTFAIAVAVLGLAAALGAYLPARRAATFDPLTVLRTD
jgi:predicted permease